jgi:hypothetical protein
VAKGKIVINVYLSTDATYDAGDTLLGTLSPVLNLTAGRSMTYNVPVVVPQVAEAAYHIVAYVDQTNVVPSELREDNNTAASTATFDLAYQFGQITGRKANVAMTLADPVTGNRVVFSSTGAGNGDVTVNPAGFDIGLTNLVAASRVTVATPVKGNTATIRNVTSGTAFSSFTAATANLVGLFSVTGALGTLSMGAVTAGDVTVTGALGTLQSLGWAGNINADTLGTLKVTGNFNADLVLANAASAAVALKSATISGGVATVTWTLTHGGLGTVKIVGAVNALDLDAPGGATSLTTGNLTNSTIDLGGAASLTMGNVANTDLTLGGALMLASAQQWVGGSITADTITALNITGKLGGTGNLDNVDVTANNAASVAVAFKSATIFGGVSNATWSLTHGGLGTVKIVGAVNALDLDAPGGGIASLTMGNVANTDLILGGALKLASAQQWVGGSITADTITALNITGKLGGTGNLDNVAVTANNAAPAKTGIGTVSIAGNMLNGSSIASTGDLGTVSILRDMTGSAISAASKIGTVKAGKMVNSTVFAGVANPPDANIDGVFDLPTALGSGAGEIASGHTIARVDILGYIGAVGSLFVNSNIAAQTISLVNLKDAMLDNDGLAFGLAGQTITKVTCRQGTVTYTWSAGLWKPVLAADNLTVRVIAGD